MCLAVRYFENCCWSISCKIPWTKRLYIYTYAKAAAICKEIGAQLASKQQLDIARQEGLPVSSCGYTSDKKAWFYDRDWKRLRWCTWRSSGYKWDAYCSEYDAVFGTLGVFRSRSVLHGSYAWTYSQAKGICQKQGASMASYRQLDYAQKTGLNVCACGWVTDSSSTGYYPMTQSISGCGSKAGIHTCTWRKKYDVYCYRTPTSVKGVFSVGTGYKYDFNDANNACKSKGARIATYNEFINAWKHGLNMCNCGWMSYKLGGMDIPVAGYPITWQTTSCGSTKTNKVYPCDWGNHRWDAWCYK